MPQLILQKSIMKWVWKKKKFLIKAKVIIIPNWTTKGCKFGNYLIIHKYLLNTILTY